MKAKILILASAFLLFNPLKQQAQSLTSGITVGATTTSAKFEDLGNSFTNTIKGNGIRGFEGGIFERINIGPVFIKPMLLGTYSSGTVTYYNNDGSEGKIEVPVLFGIRFLHFLRIEGGPVYDWICTVQCENDNSIKISPSGLGYRVGASVEFGVINLSLAYQGLTNKSGSGTQFFSPNELIFSIALCFDNGSGR